VPHLDEYQRFAMVSAQIIFAFGTARHRVPGRLTTPAAAPDPSDRRTIPRSSAHAAPAISPLQKSTSKKIFIPLPS